MSDFDFPSPIPGLKFPVKKTPAFKTGIQTALSGRELRIGYRAYPIYDINLAFEFLRDSDPYQELKTLAGFYLARSAGLDSFLFTDPDDSVATNVTIGIGDGVTTAFQLLREWSTFVEPVFWITSITNIKDNGSTVSGGSYSLGDKGLVTFTTAPVTGHTITWSGVYKFRARFLDDSIDLSKFLYQVWELQKLVLRASLQDKIT